MKSRHKAVRDVVAVTWRVDVQSLLQALGRIAQYRDKLRRTEQSDARITLTIQRTIEADGSEEPAATVEAHLPMAARPLLIAQARNREINWTCERSHQGEGWLHIDIEAADWTCALSLRTGGETSLAYARTSLFQSLGIAGGRYETLRGAVHRQDGDDRLEASA